MEKADCGRRTLSSDPGERTQTKKTQPWTGMHIRSAKIASEEVNMSGGRTPPNPSLPSSSSTQRDHGTPLTLSQAINNLVNSARQQRAQL